MKFVITGQAKSVLESRASISKSCTLNFTSNITNNTVANINANTFTIVFTSICTTCNREEININSDGYYGDNDNDDDNSKCRFTVVLSAHYSITILHNI